MGFQIYDTFREAYKYKIVFFLIIPNFSFVLCVVAASCCMKEEQTSQEVKKEVEQQLAEKERIEKSLPSSIVIGPFVVRVEAVRQALSNKRKALANAMLHRLALKLRKRMDDVGQHKYFFIHMVWWRKYSNILLK